jgi:hypothetical protein
LRKFKTHLEIWYNMENPTLVTLANKVEKTCDILSEVEYWKEQLPEKGTTAPTPKRRWINVASLERVKELKEKSYEEQQEAKEFNIYALKLDALGEIIAMQDVLEKQLAKCKLGKMILYDFDVLDFLEMSGTYSLEKVSADLKTWAIVENNPFKTNTQNPVAKYRDLLHEILEKLLYS